MNQPLSRLPGHAYAPGADPEAQTTPLTEAVVRAGRVVTDLSDLIMPLIIALAAGLTLWVVVEMVRARRRARLKPHVPDWDLPEDAGWVRPQRIRARGTAARPDPNRDPLADVGRRDPGARPPG